MKKHNFNNNKINENHNYHNYVNTKIIFISNTILIN